MINKAFIRDVTRDLFLYQTVFCLTDISFLSMYREVLQGTHRGTFKPANPKHEDRTERQSI